MTTAAIAEANQRIDAAVTITGPSFEALFGELDEAARIVALASGRGAFLRSVAPDPAARSAGDEAAEQVEKWRAAIAQREDVAQAIARFVAAPIANRLDPEQAAYVRRWQADVRLSGGGLPPDARAELHSAFDRLVELATSFQANLLEIEHLDLTHEELDGVPEAIVAGLAPGSTPSTLDVPMDEAVSVAILLAGRRRDVRERVDRARLDRGSPANRAILDEAVTIRRRIARLLGYRSWLDLRIENLAAPDAETIERFVDEMAARLEPVARAEISAMRDILAAEPDASRELVVEDWDWRYAEERQKGALGARPEDVSPYLELETVLAGLAALSESVFGVRLVEHPERTGWHPDVRAFDLVDRDTGSVLARMFFDPFAREGKAGNPFADSLDPGVRDAEGNIIRAPVLALCASAPAVSNGSSFLSLGDVDVLFHEYGHVLDFGLEPSRFAIHRPEMWIPMDWVEGPSGFLGRWGQHPAVLSEYARHHEHGGPLPIELLEPLKRVESLNLAMRILRWLSVAKLDLLLHGEEPITVEEAVGRTWPLRGTPMPEGTCEPAGYPHLLVGYDCAVYGWSWATALSDDLTSRFESEGMTSPTVGQRYRRTILEAPWTEDVMVGHERFMGRPWSSDAFFARVSRALG